MPITDKMASFFRKCIAQKVVPLLLKTHKDCNAASIVSSLVRVDRSRRKQHQLILPWEKVTNAFTETNVCITLKDLVKLLRNQGLPTAEGFIDITTCESPLGLAFTVDKHVFSKIVLMDICINEDDLAKSSCLFEDIPPKRVAIEYSCPAIGETFHMGHFRVAIHSNFIANINSFVGHDVVKFMSFKDCGLQSAVLLEGYKKFGLESELHKNPNAYLSQVMKASKLEYESSLDFRKEVDVCCEKMENGDKEILSDWEELKYFALQQHNLLYKRISCSFDDTHFDSSCFQDIWKISKELLRRELISIEQDGKVKLNQTADTSVEDSYLYKEGAKSTLNCISSSIFAADVWKQKHNFDVMYYIAPSFQKDFFELLFSLMKKTGYEWSEQLQHVKIKSSQFGSKRAKKLNAQDILDKVNSHMLNKLYLDLQLKTNENIKEVAEILGISSLCINDLKHRRNIDYDFKWEDVINFGRDSGASFQFCHAGLKGLQEDSDYTFKIDMDTSPLMEREAHDLICHLSRFDEMVHKSYIQLEPCIIFQYLSSLWYFIDRATNILKLDIKENKLTVIKARLLLLSATTKVLQKALHLLGITPLENNYFNDE